FPSWRSGGNKCGACGRTMEEVQCDSQSFHRCCFLHMVWRKNLATVHSTWTGVKVFSLKVFSLTGLQQIQTLPNLLRNMEVRLLAPERTGTKSVSDVPRVARVLNRQL
uniref:Uncharacterized protein n=1 Tax=Sus scrofa TaxID=9823 RepID=A0A8D1NQX9_PIG